MCEDQHERRELRAWAMMASVGVRESRATIRDIARLAGVSVATVSRVLNNRPDVAAATRAAVLDIVERYRPNPSARTLPHGRIGVVAVTAPFIEDRPNYLAAILAGVADALEDSNTKLLLLPARRDRPREARLRDRLKPGQVESGRAAAAHLLELEDRPTAIFAFNDEMAIGTIESAPDRGLQVPADLSVVGFDDVERPLLMTPQLTTVHQPLGEMGRIAVNLLFRVA